MQLSDKDQQLEKRTGLFCTFRYMLAVTVSFTTNTQKLKGKGADGIMVAGTPSLTRDRQSTSKVDEHCLFCMHRTAP